MEITHPEWALYSSYKKLIESREKGGENGEEGGGDVTKI